MKASKFYVLILIVLVAGLLAACGGDTPVTDETPDAPQATHTSAPDPTATTAPTSMVVCLGETPNTLYPYGNPNAAAQEVLQALYDGPVDHRGYEYQPVILESLPDMDAGTAVMQTVQVQAGDTVLDSQGNVTELALGTFVRPSGCFSGECARAYNGEPLEMGQMVALYTLRPDILWSDGTPVTAQDSVYGFNLNTDAETPADKYRVERTLSYEAVDESTTKWTGIPGFIDPEYQNNFWMPAPQHAWDSLSPAELATNQNAAQTPLSFGPFMVSDYQADTITLVRNPNYFRAVEGLPLIDRLQFRVVGQDPDLNLDMLKTGECDVLDPSAAAGIDVAQVISAMGNGELFSSFANDNGWMLLNFGIQPLSYDDGYSFWAGDRPDYFSDVRTRQAIAMCIDRQAITDEITLGIAPVMDSYVTPDHPLFNAEGAAYAYSPTDAGELLDEAGWVLNAEGMRAASKIEGVRDGTPLSFTFLYPEHPQTEQIAAMIADNLAGCGIEAVPTSMPAEELFATGEEAPVFGRNFDMVLYAWQSSEEPACHLFLGDAIPGEDEDLFPYKWGGWNASGWANEDYDTACNSARGSAPGQSSYQQDHAAAQAILMEEVPMIPLFTYQHAALARVDICGLQLDPTAGFMWNAEYLAYGDVCP